MKLWGWAQDNVSDSDMKARIIGVQTKMQTFSQELQLASPSFSPQRAELCAVYAQKNDKLSVTVLLEVHHQTGLQASIGPRSLKLL